MTLPERTQILTRTSTYQRRKSSFTKTLTLISKNMRSTSFMTAIRYKSHLWRSRSTLRITRSRYTIALLIHAALDTTCCFEKLTTIQDSLFPQRPESPPSENMAPLSMKNFFPQTGSTSRYTLLEAITPMLKPESAPHLMEWFKEI